MHAWLHMLWHRLAVNVSSKYPLSSVGSDGIRTQVYIFLYKMKYLVIFYLSNTLAVAMLILLEVMHVCVLINYCAYWWWSQINEDGAILNYRILVCDLTDLQQFNVNCILVQNIDFYLWRILKNIILHRLLHILQYS